MFYAIWEAVFRLEKCCFQVLFATFDGASVNRKLSFMDWHQRSLLTKSSTPILQSRYLNFISDPPHLMKTTKNCWFNNNLRVVYYANTVTLIFIYFCTEYYNNYNTIIVVLGRNQLRKEMCIVQKKRGKC